MGVTAGPFPSFSFSKESGEVMKYGKKSMHMMGTKAVLTKPGKMRRKSAKKASFKKGS